MCTKIGTLEKKNSLDKNGPRKKGPRTLVSQGQEWNFEQQNYRILEVSNLKINERLTVGHRNLRVTNIGNKS